MWYLGLLWCQMQFPKRQLIAARLGDNWSRMKLNVFLTGVNGLILLSFHVFCGDNQENICNDIIDPNCSQIHLTSNVGALHGLS